MASAMKEAAATAAATMAAATTAAGGTTQAPKFVGAAAAAGSAGAAMVGVSDLPMELVSLKEKEKARRERKKRLLVRHGSRAGVKQCHAYF